MRKIPFKILLHSDRSAMKTFIPFFRFIQELFLTCLVVAAGYVPNQRYLLISHDLTYPVYLLQLLKMFSVISSKIEKTWTRLLLSVSYSLKQTDVILANTAESQGSVAKRG